MMRAADKIILIFLFPVFLYSCRLKTTNITAVKYFGPVNPHDSITDQFILLPKDSAHFFLKKFRRTSAVLVKGASRYLQVEYKSGKKLVLQSAYRTPSVIRVVDKKFNLFTDKWYAINDTLIARKWKEMLRCREKSK